MWLCVYMGTGATSALLRAATVFLSWARLLQWQSLHRYGICVAAPTAAAPDSTASTHLQVLIFDVLLPQHLKLPLHSHEDLRCVML